jgi:hypothetical protein
MPNRPAPHKLERRHIPSANPCRSGDGLIRHHRPLILATRQTTFAPSVLDAIRATHLAEERRPVGVMRRRKGQRRRMTSRIRQNGE